MNTEREIWRNGILRMLIFFYTLNDLGTGAVGSFWEFWTWIHLEEFDMPISYMLCLMISSEIHSWDCWFHSVALPSLKTVSFTTCCASPFTTVGFFFPSLPWVLLVWFLYSLWLTLIPSYLLSHQDGLMLITTAHLLYILSSWYFFFFIVKAIIFMRGHGSIDKIVHLPFSSWFWNIENFNIFWSERNMVYGSMCLAFFSAPFWGGK